MEHDSTGYLCHSLSHNGLINPYSYPELPTLMMSNMLAQDGHLVSSQMPSVSRENGNVKLKVSMNISSVMDKNILNKLRWSSSSKDSRMNTEEFSNLPISPRNWFGFYVENGSSETNLNNTTLFKMMEKKSTVFKFNSITTISPAGVSLLVQLWHKNTDWSLPPHISTSTPHICIQKNCRTLREFLLMYIKLTHTHTHKGFGCVSQALPFVFLILLQSSKVIILS